LLGFWARCIFKGKCDKFADLSYARENNLKTRRSQSMLLSVALAFSTFVSTLLGGLTALRNRDRLHRILGYTAGVILGVIAFDLLPEIFEIVHTQHLDPTWPMVALVVGFLVFHIAEKTIAMHHAHDVEYRDHKHPDVGLASALALVGHSFLDGVGIGLGFQAGEAVGITVAIAVIAHDFADGLNTVSLMLTHRNPTKKAILLLILDAIAPVLGALSTLFFTLGDSALGIYLGFFTGFLLYIGASDILPEAHSKHPSKITMLLTVLGVLFMFIVTRFV
jgi:zinc transporter ZupT